MYIHINMHDCRTMPCCVCILLAYIFVYVCIMMFIIIGTNHIHYISPSPLHQSSACFFLLPYDTEYVYTLRCVHQDSLTIHICIYELVPCLQLISILGQIDDLSPTHVCITIPHHTVPSLFLRVNKLYAMLRYVNVAFITVIV